VRPRTITELIHNKQRTMTRAGRTAELASGMMGFELGCLLDVKGQVYANNWMAVVAEASNAGKKETRPGVLIAIISTPLGQRNLGWWSSRWFHQPKWVNSLWARRYPSYSAKIPWLTSKLFNRLVARPETVGFVSAHGMCSDWLSISPYNIRFHWMKFRI
jgi:hypothetical protein